MKEPQIAYSFIVDAHPRFAYEGWHLAHSLLDRASARPRDINVQFTPEVDMTTIQKFESLGCNVFRLERFGDGRYCNKLSQLDNLRKAGADHFVFLDTDMIAIADFRDSLAADSISAKVVDLPNPSIEVLDEIMAAAGFDTRPTKCSVDASQDVTYVGNCNGGLYSVPRKYADALFDSWKRWAVWLLANIDPLKRSGKDNHVDQVSFCLALHEKQLPFVLMPSNLNYFIHIRGPHLFFDKARSISMLHYHSTSLNVLGSIQAQGATYPAEVFAVESANRQIATHFDSRLILNFRSAHFVEHSSGIRSRARGFVRKLLSAMMQ